jgi:adenine-specific DNA-methyltransferase
VASVLDKHVSEDKPGITGIVEGVSEMAQKRKFRPADGRVVRRRRTADSVPMARRRGVKKIPDNKKVGEEAADFGASGKVPAKSENGGASKKRSIEQYAHEDKTRLNNPPVGLVTPETDRDTGRKTYQYDPHLDPTLQWAGKAERLSFEVPTVSLHVHERIDPKTIIQAVKRKNGVGGQPSLFDSLEEPDEPLREALDFYRHAHGWSNRLIAGDSLLVMNSLLEKEGLGGKVQMVYLDPPYGIKYGSNFQPFVNKRDVKDGKDEDLTQEPEMIRAFRDTWELGIHSYLTYLRDRLLLARELLTESGSCFVQISDDNVHLVRCLMAEVFGTTNFVSEINFTKTITQTTTYLPTVADYVIWYAKDKTRLKYRPLFTIKRAGEVGASRYEFVELPNGERRRLTGDEISNLDSLPDGARVYTTGDLTSQEYRPDTSVSFKFNGVSFTPGANRHWNLSIEGIDRLAAVSRIVVEGKSLRAVRYLDDSPAFPIPNLWSDTMGIQSRSDPRVYIVQTATTVVARCMLMTTDPGDLVFDPTCGSGTTAFVAENWGRRWITCDTSRVAVTLAKQRLMTAAYDYYELQHPKEGIASGFLYKTVPHVTLKSIANNPDIKPGMKRDEIDAAIKRHADIETLYDQPHVDNKKVRVTGPFTVEAVPAPAVRPITEIVKEERLVDVDGKASLPGMEDPLGRNELGLTADITVARSGPTLRHTEWRDELLRCGVRAKGGQKLEFSRVEPLGGLRWLHADAEARTGSNNRVAISFGPEHAPLEQKQVELAWQESRQLSPKPGMLLFCAFQFDPEAAKDIDELTPEKTGMTLLKVQMNTDLLTEDLKKKRSSNESYWLIGQPDVDVRPVKTGADKGKYRVEVKGFDYYNPRTGAIESGGTEKIAVWMLDTDYDGRSLFPRQVFFPMAGEKDGWARLAKNLKAEIDEGLIEQYRGTVSLPFTPGPHKCIAVKIVDDRGIESLKVVGV